MCHSLSSEMNGLFSVSLGMKKGSMLSIAKQQSLNVIQKI